MKEINNEFSELLQKIVLSRIVRILEVQGSFRVVLGLECVSIIANPVRTLEKVIRNISFD